MHHFWAVLLKLTVHARRAILLLTQIGLGHMHCGRTLAFSGKTYWRQQCLPALALSKLTLFELPIDQDGRYRPGVGVFQIGYSFLFNCGSTVVRDGVGFEESS
ncbi:hypothetical protein JB92DRAFT_3073248 [Gautieria morchelliformis]|nr:hypothetical protein JB92DRAFT_3073248 [Gautieria morchelliformis]